MDPHLPSLCFGYPPQGRYTRWELAEAEVEAEANDTEQNEDPYNGSRTRFARLTRTRWARLYRTRLARVTTYNCYRTRFARLSRTRLARVIPTK
jgi:hypothetical protein